ncbi:UPF0382 membrane protein YwdK isoform X1 [Amborella trichopoda]|uniref:UPF0382 membrane protein YwdK isoform X1 n=1 Tax=Amborella trichopoda TaxID=13333 RepID=UPI0009BE8FF4|nr:UPF0382 membrane protein YwdK isoform X1 [Amborella trichopoda]|eukprot:XP_020525829.1 UPF0382 membrane protein YwdK isoform X1 [Amborella trichopoda]
MDPLLWHRVAAVSGVAALGLGTYGAHVFQPHNPAYKDVWQTASLYHLVHTAALLAAPITKHPHVFGSLLTTGILAFSGTMMVVVIMMIIILLLIMDVHFKFQVKGNAWPWRLNLDQPRVLTSYGRLGDGAIRNMDMMLDIMSNQEVTSINLAHINATSLCL